MKVLKIFSSGLLVSLLGALPVGTLNITAFQISSTQNLNQAFLFAVAVILVELIVVGLLLSGADKIIIYSKQAIYLLPFAIILLLYLAVTNFISAGNGSVPEQSVNLFPIVKSSFLLGLLLSTFNPMQIPFWVGWNSVLTEKKILENKPGIYLSYLTGIGAGTFAGLALFIVAGKFIFINYQQYSFIIGYITGFLYLLFALYFLVRFYRNHINFLPGKILENHSFQLNSVTWFQLKLYKLVHWEYWPMELIYFPVFPVWFFYALKAKSFFFFNASNPGIKNGGMAMESKKEIYDLIPQQYIPKTVLIKKGTSIDEILRQGQEAEVRYPFIAKPDIGMKGLGVDKIKDEHELQVYLNKISDDFLIQELIYFPNEVGIFYVRMPDEKAGRITGIVLKEFLSVDGNGHDTILQLIKQNPRSCFQLPELNRKYGNYLDTILPSGEKFILVPYGSHTRGSKFIDISEQQNERLLKTINDICLQIDGFYFGRLDIRYSSFDELCEGKNFSIIEVNGAGSEPTHIYDPNHSLFFAWKEIIRHWKMLYIISMLNNEKGHTYLSYKEGSEMIKENRKLEARIKLI